MRKVFALVLAVVLMLGMATTVHAEEQKTLKIVGCGAFSASGPDGTIDVFSGREKPGYNVIVEEWNRLHPDVKLEIEAYPWDNWQASIQTAVMAGGVDVIMHGATLTDLSMPLDDLIAADPEFDALTFSYARRRSDNLGPLSKSYVTGVPVTVAPEICFINKEILEHYGVEMPTAEWTWDDLLAIAEKVTGTDPVTGEQTYGLLFFNPHSDNEIWKFFTNVGYGIGANPTVTYGETAKDSSVTYNDENALKIWEFLSKLAQFTSPADREGVDVSNIAADFDIAMYFYEDPVAYYKNLVAAGEVDRYVPISLPTVSAGELQGKITPYCGDSNLAISKTSEQVDLAWEYIKFSVTNPVAINYYVENSGVVNNVEHYNSLNTIVSQDLVDAIGRAIQYIPDTYSPASGMYSNNISFGNLNATIGAGIRSLLMGTATPEEAANKVQATVDEYMASIQ